MVRFSVNITLRLSLRFRIRSGLSIFEAKWRGLECDLKPKTERSQ